MRPISSSKATINDLNNDANKTYHDILKASRDACWQITPAIHVAPQDVVYEHQEQMHFHAHPEIFIQLQGCNHFRYPTAAFDLEAGGIAIVPAGVPHGETFDPGDDDGEFLSIVIMPNHAHTGILSAHTQTYGAKQTVHYMGYPALPMKSFLGVLQQCIQLHKTDALSSQHLLAALFTMILRVMKKPYREDHHKYSEKIRSCRHLIYERFVEANCTVQALAKELGCTPNYLSARFKKECGESMSHFLNMTRLNHASDLLLNTDLSIQHIAWSCGFNAPSYFIARFQEAYGETPGSFKRQAD